VKKYYKTANIENANIHTLRRTFGSIMVQQGVDIFTVSKLLGHSSVTVSEKHYADLLPSNLKAGVKVLEKALRRKPKKKPKKQKKESS
jgi:site-specific recombinase XerD